MAVASVFQVWNFGKMNDEQRQLKFQENGFENVETWYGYVR